MHKTIAEVDAMPADEYVGWLGYFMLKKEERDRETT